MAFRLAASWSNSSREPLSAIRWLRSPAMIRRVVRLIASTRPSIPRLIEAAGEPEQQRESEAPAQRAPDLRLDLQAVLDLAPDQQRKPSSRRKLWRACPALFDLSPSGLTSTAKSASRPPRRRLGPAVEVAGDALAEPVNQQVDAGAVRLMPAAHLDHLAQAIEPLRRGTARPARRSRPGSSPRSGAP